jgi:hypothetical protein
MTLVWLLCVGLVLAGLVAFFGPETIRAAFGGVWLALFGARVRARRLPPPPAPARPAAPPSPQGILPPPHVVTRPRA